MAGETTELGRLLRDLRRARGLSQEQVAEATGVMVQPNISAYERGVWKPEPDRLRILAQALAVPYSRLAVAAGYQDDEAAEAPSPEADPVAADLLRMAESRPDLMRAIRAVYATGDPAVIERAQRTMYRFLIGALETVRDMAEPSEIAAVPLDDSSLAF